MRLIALAALLVWLAVTLPLALGWETLFLRDVFETHLHFRAFGARELAAGRIPVLRPDWGLGQPFAGNPNALAFYPDSLLYLLLPFWSAFNLHYMLHWLLAFFTFRSLTRELGMGPPASLLAALTYAGCGWMLSNLTFYNLLTVAAWWPLAIAGAVRGGWRGIALGGLACGLALLGGEPVTATLGLVPLVWLAVERHGGLRGLSQAAAVGIVGLAVALPQVVATARIVGHSWRGMYGVATTARDYSLHLPRVVELLVPLSTSTPETLTNTPLPFVLSIHVGVTALALAIVGSRPRPGWAVLAVLGLILAWAGAWISGPLGWLSLGLFRYPEKFLVWFAIFLPLLAGAGVESVRRTERQTGSATRESGPPRARRPAIPALVLASLALLLLVGVLLSRGSLPAGAAASWPGSLLLSAVLLLVTAGALWKRSLSALPLVQLLALLPLLALVPTDETAFYRRPAPWRERLTAGTTVFSTTWSPLFKSQGDPVYRFDAGASMADLRRVCHLDLDYPTGVLMGLSYPLAPDLEGLHDQLFHRFLQAFPRMPPDTAGTWLRTLGVEAVTAVGPPPAAGLSPVAQAIHAGVPTTLYRVVEPVPRVWCPETVELVPTPAETLSQVGQLPDPVRNVLIPIAMDHRPCTRARTIEETPDRWVLEVEGEGGLVVLRRAFQPLYRAHLQGSTGDSELTVVPANLLLLGVEVPAGRHRVVVEVAHWPEILAGLLAGLVAASSLVTLLRPAPSRTRAEQDQSLPA